MEELKIRRSQLVMGSPVKVRFYSGEDENWGDCMLPYSVWVFLKKVIEKGLAQMVAENKDFPLKIVIKGFVEEGKKKAVKEGE